MTTISTGQEFKPLGVSHEVQSRCQQVRHHLEAGLGQGELLPRCHAGDATGELVVAVGRRPQCLNMWHVLMT